MASCLIGTTVNISHLAKHQILSREAAEAILDPDVIMLEIQHGDEDRVKAVERTRAGRIIVIPFALRGDAIRAVTAYDATIRLQKLYLERAHL
jgi:uncharacterized DUF497 family protein